MKPGNMPSVEELQASSRFESLRKILLSQQFADHLDRPLAYWALPTDRRLPLALLGRSLKDLLNTPFAELAGTPGIGRKKLHSFVQLLARAANTDPRQLPLDQPGHAQSPQVAFGNGFRENVGGFDPDSVSEIVWSQWCASVVRHGLEKETLGRLAPSLRSMTRVIWNTPLEAYVGRTLREIRALKTHGEKRVRAVLEVFHSVHTLVAGMGTQEHLVVRIVPKWVDRVERWVNRALQTPGIPSEEEIFEKFITPLLEQVRMDAPRQITSLAENRLGISGPITSVRQAARSMGLTRARVYQLLNEINDIMVVRWPIGRHQVYELCEKLRQESAHAEATPSLTRFYAAVELFYPGSRRGAAGPLDQAPADKPVTPSFTAPEMAVG